MRPNLLVRPARVVLHASPAVGANGDRDAANAVGRVARRRDRAARLLRRLHERHEKILHADVEQPLRMTGVVPCRPHDGVAVPPAIACN